MAYQKIARKIVMNYDNFFVMLKWKLDHGIVEMSERTTADGSLAAK